MQQQSIPPPDANPAASSFPKLPGGVSITPTQPGLQASVQKASGPARIPIPDSADVPQIVRERHDEPSVQASGDRARVEVVRQFFALADQEYQRGLRDMAEAVLDQLKRQGPVYVQTLLDEMDRAPGRVVLDALRRDGR